MHDKGYIEYSKPEQRNGAGENLARYESAEMRYSDLATVMWYYELIEPGYNFKEPGIGNGGTKHFTQLIWKNCTHIGLGIVGGYVCGRYSPAGNT